MHPPRGHCCSLCAVCPLLEGSCPVLPAVLGWGYAQPGLAAPLAPVASVLAACRRAGLRIVHTRQGFRPDLADLTPFLVEKFKRSGVTIGSKGRQCRKASNPWPSQFTSDVLKQVWQASFFFCIIIFLVACQAESFL